MIANKVYPFIFEQLLSRNGYLTRLVDEGSPLRGKNGKLLTEKQLKSAILTLIMLDECKKSETRRPG